MTTEGLISGAVGIVIGVLLGLVVPPLVLRYQIIQMAYGRGYSAGRSTHQAHVRKALRRLVDCRHTPPNVCDACASFTRGELALLLREDE